MRIIEKVCIFLLNCRTLSAPNLPPFYLQLSKSDKIKYGVENCNIALITTSDKTISAYCFFSDEIESGEVYINSDVISPNTSVQIELKFIDPSNTIESLQLKPQFKNSLLGLPIVPNSTLYYSYQGRIRQFTNTTPALGFISNKTQFIFEQKIELDNINHLLIEQSISERIVKMIRHRHSIITKSLLIVGNCGSGKSYFIENMTKTVKNCVSLNLLKFISELELSRFDYIDSVLSIEDGVLLIDDVCILSSQIASILVEKLSILDDKPVIIIGSSRLPPYSLPVPLQAQFPHAMNIRSLSHDQRREIIKNYVPSEFLDFVVRETSGSTLGELNNLVKIIPSIEPFSAEAFKHVLQSISTSEKPHQLRTSNERHRLAGYSAQIDEIRLFLRVSFSEDSSLLQYSGIMLTGPSGNGKSFIIRALAEEFEVPFFVIEFDKIFSQFLGESERAIRDVFQAARFFAPCAIIIEDIDAIGSKRNDESGVGGRVLSTLLNEIDGVDKKAKVLLIATTNAPQIVDSALMRPGRFDKIIEIGQPTEQDRVELIQLLREKTPVSDEVQNEWLASNTNGLTCAEIQSFFRFSALQALKDGKECVTKDYFDLGLKRIEERKSYFAKLQRKSTFSF